MTPHPTDPKLTTKVTPGAPAPALPKCPWLRGGVLDCVTPPQYAAHVDTQRAYLDTGAGFNIEPGRWLESWWVGGWEGKREEINPDKLIQMAMNLPKYSVWILNVWENGYDQRILDANNKPIDVERRVDQIRDYILKPIKKARPDIARGFYASIPSEHLDITIYHQAKRMVERIDAGEQIVNPQWWRNKLAQVQPRYEAWIEAVTRMTYGFDTAGKLDTGGGLIDELDILNPKCYLVGDLNDGAFDASDIESDTYQITEQVKQAKRVADGRGVYPMFAPYIEGTNKPPKKHRFEFALKSARNAGADGVTMWHYTGGVMPNEWERTTMDMATNVFMPRLAA